ncbi:restriction endonuclease subunit S [Methanocalculus sp. MC3]
MNTMTKLNEITTDLITGVAARIPNPDEQDVYSVINIKDIIDGRVDTTSLDKRVITSPRIKPESYVKEGDLVIAIRGPNFKVGIIDTSSQGFLFTTNLIGLRLDPNKALPEVVAAYLNSPEGQHTIASNARGVITPSINKKDLLGIKIPLPSIETQQQVQHYLKNTEDYLHLLHHEEASVRKIRDYVIFRSLGVNR